MRKYEQAAEEFCEAIRLCAEKPDNLKTLEHHLANHFDTWLEKYANKPENFVEEMSIWANLE